MMEERIQELDMDEMNAEIARSRKEVVSLTASLERLSGGKSGIAVVEPEPEQSGLRKGLHEVGAGGGEAAKGLLEEMKKHPLITGATAFSIGFVIALLVFKRG